MLGLIKTDINTLPEYSQNIEWTDEEEILPNGFTHSIEKLMVELGG